MSGTVKRRCGTCRHWDEATNDGEVAFCGWPEPSVLPFWASISRGDDHADWTRQTDGRACAAWEPGP